MAEKKGYFQPGFASTIETVSELGALAEKLAFLIRSKLWVQIVVCMVLGIGIGLLVSPEGAALVSDQTAELITGWLVLPGHLFLALIQMIMLPLVVSSIVLGIAGAEDLTKLRKMGLRIAPYFVATTTVAVLIGVVLATFVEPGQYIDPNMLSAALADTGPVKVSENQEVLTLHAFQFGMASAITAAILWLACSLLVMLMPSMMLSMSGEMVHMQLNEMGWHLTLTGVVIGLVAWFVTAGIAGWLLAAIYNRLQSSN